MNRNLATVIAARDAGLQKPVYVLAICPVKQISLNTESYLEQASFNP